MAEEKKVVLLSSDGVSFELKQSVALQSEVIKVMMAGPRAGQPIPVLNVTGEILAKVVEYLEKHREAAEAASALPGVMDEWDRQFVEVDTNTIMDLVLAANFLEIKSMLDLVCSKVADMIKGKTPEEIRTFLNIKTEFTPDEEMEIRRENQFAFE